MHSSLNLFGLRWILVAAAMVLLCACDTQGKEDAQATQVAMALHGTQTAMAPTATVPSTDTPIPTATVTPPPTTTPTITPTPTQAPLSVGEVFDLISPAVAYVDTGVSSGSGVLIAGGYLLTNAHVVWPHETVRVVFGDGDEFPEAPVVCWDLLADLALVGPLDVDIEPLPLVDREDLDVASEVVLIGYPGEGEDYPQPTVSRGVLSRIREWEALGITYFQTDAAISGGQSGGVLVSDRAEVIGISGFAYTDAFGLAASAADIVPRLGSMLTCDDLGGLGARKMPSGVGVKSAYVELESGEIDAYVLREDAGTEIDLEVESAGLGGLVVIPPAGEEPMNLSTAPGRDSRGTFTTESTGAVFLLVAGDPLGGSTVQVSSSHPMHPVPDPDAMGDSTGSHEDTVLTVGESVVGCLDYPFDLDTWDIELDKGEIVDIKVSSVLVDPMIMLDFVGAGDHELYEDDDSGGGLFDLDARLVYQAPHEGVYQLHVTNLTMDTGGYHVSVSSASEDTTPEPTRPAPTPTPTVVKSKYGSMAYFHVEDGPFGLRIPAEWEYDDEISDPYLNLLAFAGPRDRIMMISHENAEGMDLDEYTDFYVDYLKDMGYTLSSRKSRTTDSGLEVNVLRMWSNQNGGVYRLVAIEDGEAINVTFMGSSLTSLNNISGLIYEVFDSVAVDMPEATPTPAPRAEDDVVTLRAMMLKNPSSLDPGVTMDGTSSTAIEQLYLGLTDFDDETGEVVPELAHKWTVSDDGLVWTFYLRDDARWVRYDEQTGKAEVMGRVTAGDVVYGIKRALNPETHADAAAIDYIIKNAESLHKGESRMWSDLGVTALDDLTIEFRLEYPAFYFPAIAGLPVNRPVPYGPIGEHGDAWTEPGNLWTNGPYMLADWQVDESMVMVKNDAYFGAEDVQIERVEWSIVSLDTAQAMYLNGELDIAYPLPAALDKHPSLSDEISKADRLSTTFVGFNTTKPPFDDPRVRRAFAMATDKSIFEWDDPTFSQLLSDTFGPPGLAGSPAASDDYEPMPYDPEAARELLAEAGYPDGKGLPDIEFGVSKNVVQTAMALRSGWEANLGVKIILQVGTWEQHQASLNKDAPQMYHYGWAADYPDEHNFVYNVCHPTKGLNYSQWQADAPGAAEFIKVVEEAAAEEDSDDRIELYARAETILCVEQAVLVPLYHPQESYLAKPYLERTYARFGGEHIDRWSISQD